MDKTRFTDLMYPEPRSHSAPCYQLELSPKIPAWTTGAGHIAYHMWNSCWNLTGQHRRAAHPNNHFRNWRVFIARLPRKTLCADAHSTCCFRNWHPMDSLYNLYIHLVGDGCMLQQLISAGWYRIYGYPDSSAIIAFLLSDSAVLIK